MKDTSYLVIALLLLLLSCGDENPLNPDEQNQRGTISGTVVDTIGNTLSDVSITLDGTGHTSTSNSEGAYIIPDVPTGIYTLTFTRTNYFDTTVSGVSVSKMQNVTTVNVKMCDNPSDGMVERGVNGELTGNTDEVSTVYLELSGDSIPEDSPMITKMGWDPVEKSFSRFIYRPKEGDEWKLAVKVYDSLNRIIGYKEKAVFNLTGDIAIPAFDAENAKPQITITSDSLPDTYSFGDTAFIPFTVIDSFGTVEKLSFLLGSKEYPVDVNDTIASFEIPDTISGNLQLELLAIDSDENHSKESLTLKAGVYKLESPIHSISPVPGFNNRHATIREKSVNTFEYLEFEKGRLIDRQTVSGLVGGYARYTSLSLGTDKMIFTGNVDGPGFGLVEYHNGTVTKVAGSKNKYLEMTLVDTLIYFTQSDGVYTISANSYDTIAINTSLKNMDQIKSINDTLIISTGATVITGKLLIMHGSDVLFEKSLPQFSYWDISRQNNRVVIFTKRSETQGHIASYSLSGALIKECSIDIANRGFNHPLYEQHFFAIVDDEFVLSSRSINGATIMIEHFAHDGTSLRTVTRNGQKSLELFSLGTYGYFVHSFFCDKYGYSVSDYHN